MSILTPNALTKNEPAPADTKTDKTKPETEKKKAEPRPYAITRHVTGTAEKLKQTIDELVKDGKGEIFVVLGQATSLQPKLALQTHLSQNPTPKADWAVFSRGAVKEFPGVGSEVPTQPKLKVVGL